MKSKIIGTRLRVFITKKFKWRLEITTVSEHYYSSAKQFSEVKEQVTIGGQKWQEKRFDVYRDAAAKKIAKIQAYLQEQLNTESLKQK